ncbi:MAG: MerR family transcriptional regulator [Crenarchaeota archaeon]|nr:MerR family transcriptional regulator [Thermoproteota archaeon]
MKKYSKLFQIGEVAELFNISRNMILNYINHRLLAPTLVDRDTGFRYFDCFAIAKIQLILDLRNMGLSIPEIGKYFSGILSVKKQIATLQNQITSIQKTINQLEVRDKERDEQQNIKEIIIPERYCIVREVVAKDFDDAVSLFVETFNSCIERKLKFANGCFHFCELLMDLFDEDFYNETNIPIRICISIIGEHAPKDAVIYPQTKALSISFCGKYSNIYEPYESLKKYIIDNGYKVSGFPQEHYLEGDFNNNSDKNIVWIVIPIAEE